MNDSLLEEACPCVEDNASLEGPADLVGRATDAAIAQLTGGLSPASIEGTFSDRASHLAIWLGRQIHLTAKPARKFIASEPGHPGRHFQMMTHAAPRAYIDPDNWVASAQRQDGSWWPAWGRWLASRAAQPALPSAPGAPNKGFAPLGSAPGTYVLER